MVCLLQHEWGGETITAAYVLLYILTKQLHAHPDMCACISLNKATCNISVHCVKRSVLQPETN